MPIVETNEIATTKKDLDLFSGWATRLENPDPVLRTESGGHGLKLYDEVSCDAHAKSVLQTRYLSVVGKEWQVEAASEKKSDRTIAEYVKSVLYGCNFGTACQELLRAILYGYYTCEIMWTYSEGNVGIDKMMGKHPRRFVFTPERDLRLLTPANMVDGEEVPERKFIVFTCGDSDNPYGDGLGKTMWWPVWFKKHGIKYWVMFAEKFGSPTAVGKYPPGTNKTDQDNLLSAIEAIQQETGIIVPENMLVELLEAARTSSVNTYESLCEYMDKQISKAVLGQTASTEGTPGKLGNEHAQESVRDDITRADADLLSECLNNTLIRWIVDFNFPSVTAYPKLWIRCEEEKDLKPLAERDKIVSEILNSQGKKIDDQYFEDTYQVPLADVPQPQQGAMEEPKEFAEARFTPEQQALEGLADTMLDRGTDVFAGITEPVKQIIQQSASFEDLREKLLSAYAEMDSEEFDELLQRSIFAADMWGRYSAQGGK